jgi:hypothetical protein
MVRLTKISLFELPELIHLCYKNDDDLLQKYHLAPMDLGSAIESTFGMIYTASRIKKLSIYKVVYQKQPIGYVVTYNGDFLYSYAIAPKFRKKDILINWWQEIKSVLKKEFATMVYDWNSRAAKFLEKNGMQLAAHDTEKKILTYINTK